MRVGIIGAGPGGLALGILLRRAGFHGITIFDREDGVGGTWRINTYSGLACDVKSHLYSYSFAFGSRVAVLGTGSTAPQLVPELARIADTVYPVQRSPTWILPKPDRPMQGTVWITQCSNYFRAPNGRVVTQWPRSAGAFWGMTRRFKPVDFAFAPVPGGTR